jgi:hypothetical protein
MKTINTLKAAVFFVATALLVGCGTSYRGSATDRTGTNGATNGNGKVMSTSAHNQTTN